MDLQPGFEAPCFVPIGFLRIIMRENYEVIGFLHDEYYFWFMPPSEDIFSSSLLYFTILELHQDQVKVVHGYLHRTSRNIFPSVEDGGGVREAKIRYKSMIIVLKNLLHLLVLKDAGNTKKLFIGFIPKVRSGYVP